MLYVFVDLTFLTTPDGAAEQSLVDKFFPIVFLVVGLYMLRAAWDQHKIGRKNKSIQETAMTTDAKPGTPAKGSSKSE